MKRPVLALAAAGALTFPVASLAAAEIDIKAEGPVVELSVFESISVVPDIATIGAGVTTEAPTATEALSQNSAEMTKVVARLKAMGIAEKDIQTTGISLNARYDYDQASQRTVFRGYQASNRVSVILRKIADTGKVLDALVAAGATDLNGPAFSIENDEAAKEEARKRAIARAQARVKAYADLFGYDSAKVLWISESIEGRGAMPEMAMMKADAGMVAAAPPPVQSGMVSTGIALSFKFELLKDAAP
ncbi:SIMPL domain-containing protein [Erythrobacter tepidarius]|uniref:SIMPL domain-containing protein n=1 Tax=Erythrobacter tepidarius TaxID=60454 RepID=UPI000A369D35|nr:SIMPL domain-containing protein [Erythrobacter tepidarius]